VKRSRSFLRYRNGNRDANHAAIASGLRKLGYLVIDLAGAGSGAPDLLVFSRTGRQVFIELKTQKGRLRESQKAFAARLTSYDVAHGVARTLEDALVLVGHDVRARVAANAARVEAAIASELGRLRGGA
jgi:hypothetical protein